MAAVVAGEEYLLFGVGDSYQDWRWVIPLFLVKFTDEGKLVTDRPTDGWTDQRKNGPTDGRTHPLIETHLKTCNHFI